MPLVQERCSGECRETVDRCPDCDAIYVTPLDNPPKPTPSKIAAYGGPNKITYTNICWECGWREEVTVTFEREIVP